MYKHSRLIQVHQHTSTTYSCKNSVDFLRIQKDNLTDRIDRVIMADERDHTSEGVVLARKHEVP